MPTSSDRLREKFMVEGSDGIEEAETIVKKWGAEVDKFGHIKLLDYWGENSDEFWDAVNFLVDEWDYAVNI